MTSKVQIIIVDTNNVDFTEVILLLFKVWNFEELAS